MSSSRKKWLCLDCGVDTGKIHEHYFINTQTWLEVVGSKVGMLCITCLEIRLGRKLNSKDFPDVHINNRKLYPMSAKLLQRMGK